jgi:hypothetical protein
MCAQKPRRCLGRGAPNLLVASGKQISSSRTADAVAGRWAPLVSDVWCLPKAMALSRPCACACAQCSGPRTRTSADQRGSGLRLNYNSVLNWI